MEIWSCSWARTLRLDECPGNQLFLWRMHITEICRDHSVVSNYVCKGPCPVERGILISDYYIFGL